jgi:hypothetical protein
MQKVQILANLQMLPALATETTNHLQGIHIIGNLIVDQLIKMTHRFIEPDVPL